MEILLHTSILVQALGLLVLPKCSSGIGIFVRPFFVLRTFIYMAVQRDEGEEKAPFVFLKKEVSFL